MAIHTYRGIRTKAAAVMGAAVIAVVFMAVAPVQKTSPKAPAPVRLPSSSGLLRRDAVVRIVREHKNAVVSLHTLRVLSEAARLEASRWLRVEPVQEGLGSGFMIDSSGLILTNAHVVENVDVVHVRTPDGEDIDAEVVGRDPEDDLALIRASGISVHPVTLGDSDRIEVGDWVVAIGNPLGLHHTVTVGIISAKARGIDQSGIEFLQTDAAINPGSSGGPLFDLDGNVVGVTTAIISGGSGNVGLNFAIPINSVKAALPQLKTGRVVHGWTGVVTLAINAEGARHYGLRSPTDGLYVSEVAPGSPADQAGLQPGDVILWMDTGTRVNARDFHTRLRQLTPGTQVTLRVLRDGQQLELRVTIGVRPTG